ncbi:MAG: hypothetical protein ACYDA8_06585, partial [Deferrisomatales bacterium]
TRRSSDLLKGAPPAAGETGGGGGLSGLVAKAASLFGGGGGQALGLAGMLGQTGLDVGKIAPFVGLFVGFLKKKLDSGLVGRLLTQVPERKGTTGA